MHSMRLALVGAVAVLVSCGGGSSSTTSEASSTTSEASSTTTDAGAEVVYKVGDTGPGGGIIVYVDEAGFDNSSGDGTSIGAVCFTVRCHYLEIAPVLEGAFYWYGAIKFAQNYSTATADDWVLPSRDALNEICKYAFGDTVNAICNDDGSGAFLNSVGGFSPVHYWSSSETDYWGSSETDGNHAWAQNFTNGNQGIYGSNDETYYGSSTAYGLPVRAF